ncbi:MAG TPA: hypothetical protein VLA90_02720 [Actinomycetota bacterium]|nr:hypothetical protein [Actinomycetota bacterium]
MSRARLGALLAICALVGGVDASFASAPEDPVDLALVFLVPEVSFEEMLGSPEIASLATAGGAALMVPQGGVATEGWRLAPTTSADIRFESLETDLESAAATIRRTVAELGERRVLVFVASTTASPAMRDQKDEVHPLVMASGPASGLFPDPGDPRALTSDSTRRSGVVSDLDVATTLAAGSGSDRGSVIRVIDEPAPFELHERYLAQRRLSVPFGVAALAYLGAVGVAAVIFVARPLGTPDGWRRAAGWGCLSVATLATGMFAAGHLPELSYATAVPMVAIVAVFGTMAFSPLLRPDATLVPAGIGAAVIAFFVVEALLGWRGMVTPLAGASQLDGARFFGLPNLAVGLLVGAGLWVVPRLTTSMGFGVLCGIGLLAGLPVAGANLGGAVTAFAAAGMWLAVRERARLGAWRGLAVAAVSTIVGTGVVVAAHVVWPVPTHVTRIAETSGGLAGVIERYRDRLEIGVDLLSSHPAALVPVVGLPIALLVVRRPPAAIRSTFERRPAWRDAVLVTLLAGVVAYLANDTGAAAAGWAFGLGVGGMLGVSLLSGPGKMGSP